MDPFAAILLAIAIVSGLFGLGSLATGEPSLARVLFIVFLLGFVVSQFIELVRRS